MSLRRICLWSGPRNVSTALMYAFAQRPDTTVIDEPLYGHFLHVSGAQHPGRMEVLAAMETDADKVIREVIFGDYKKPVVFFKQMAHHLEDLERDFLRDTTNVILIRDPQEMLPSLQHQIPRPTLRDSGLAVQAGLWEWLTAAGQRPPVLDSRELLSDNRGVLKKLCRAIDIAFDPAMLSWPAGRRPEDGVWAKYWYQNLHRSTGFIPYRPKTAPFPEDLRPLLSECRPYYEQLFRQAIRAEQKRG